MSADDHPSADPAPEKPPVVPGHPVQDRYQRPMHRVEHLGTDTQAIRSPLAPKPKRPAGEDTERVTRPGDVHVYAESVLTKVARGFAILRDAFIIAGLVAFGFFAHALLAGLHNAVQPDQGNPAPAPAATQTYPCPTPTVDTWGTFCPITPGD